MTKTSCKAKLKPAPEEMLLQCLELFRQPAGVNSNAAEKEQSRPCQSFSLAVGRFALNRNRPADLMRRTNLPPYGN
jgi:hypothetical protein